MDTTTKRKITFANIPYALTIGAAALLILSSVAAYADGPYTMAPPVQSSYDSSYSAPAPDSGDASADSVFNWNEVPENQQVPITRAVFDQGGYQLYDSVGETIVVPFTDNNLYVMKFAVSPNDTMFFVNEGDAPVLYVPKNGYLENATVSGARWYPFSDDFHPADPVFIGCAPSWSAFISMGWYPGMVCYGGYWCGVSFWDGGVFAPCVGLTFVIGGHPCYGWDAFDDYCYGHPDWHPIGFYHPYVYRWADAPHPFGHPFAGGHPWSGASASSSGRGFGGNHGWSEQGANRSYGSGHSWSSDNSDHAFQGSSTGSGWNNRWSGNHDGSFQGGDRSFGGAEHSSWQGNGGGDRGFGGNSGADSSHVFRGAVAAGGGQPDWGNRSFGGGQPSFGGGDRSFGGQNDAGPAHAFSGGSSSWQDRSSGDRSFQGGSDRSFSGGGDRSYSSGGGRSFSGGGDSGRSHDSRSGDNSGGGGGRWGH